MDATNKAPIASCGDSVERINGASSTSDEVKRPASLRVLIAGAGIGGLSTALFLRHAGHRVEVGYPDVQSETLGFANPTSHFSSLLMTHFLDV